MTAKDDDKKEDKPEEVKKDEKKETTTPPMPPLIAASRRLERLLGPTALHDMYSNPAKVVRRWLGTASGAAGKATLEDVAYASKTLLENPPDALLLLVDESDAMMETEEEDKKEEKLVAAAVPVQSWLVSLAVRILWRDAKYEEAFQLAQQGIDELNGILEQDNVSTKSSSLFPLLARLYRLRSLVAERLPQVNLFDDLIQAHSAACQKRNVDCQAVLLNLLLRNLLASKQIEEAYKLLENSTFPEQGASNNQLCRYLYYKGRIQALRLEYTSAYSNLSQSLRKAPTTVGLGFRITVQRLLVVVQLLMGEIPDRSIFFVAHQKKELAPYLSITQAVRRGDLHNFQHVVETHQERLAKDETLSLISRLAHVVVKAGLRKLNVSYSRISLEDVATRLGLPSAASAEFVVSKAVRDGVVDATLTREYMQSHDLLNVYQTEEPAQAFHRRIQYCLQTHNDAVRAMRYSPQAYKLALAKSRGNVEKPDKTDEEMAQEIEEEMEEDEY